MTIVLRQIQEKCREQNKSLYATFVDVAKAFNTVSRDGLQKILLRQGCPLKLLKMLQLFNKDQGPV